MNNNTQENVEGDLNFLIIEYLSQLDSLSKTEKEEIVQKVYYFFFSSTKL